MLGDARREEVLRQAAVPNAQRVIVAADRDDTSVLVTLTARRLAPDAMIAAAAREEQNIAVLRQSGADVVIPTAESAGRLLGLSIFAPNAGELIEDLLEPVAGLQISEREVTPGGRRPVARRGSPRAARSCSRSSATASRTGSTRAGSRSSSPATASS